MLLCFIRSQRRADAVTPPTHTHTPCSVKPRSSLLQMTESCSTAAGSGTRSDRAASKETSWAAASCSPATSPPTVSFPRSRFQGPAQRPGVNVPFVSDDADDWDLEVFSKPSDVQNDLYAGNEDEEGEGEDLEGKKVMVRRPQRGGKSNNKKLHTPPRSSLI